MESAPGHDRCQPSTAAEALMASRQHLRPQTHTVYRIIHSGPADVYDRRKSRWIKH